MKRKLLAVMGICLMALAGCGASSVNKTFTLNEEYDGVKIESKFVLEGSGDDLDKTTETIVWTFDNADDYSDEIAEMIAEYEEYKECPLESIKRCSAYIDFDYSQSENTITTTEVTRYQEARKAKEEVDPSLVYSDKEYYSVEKTINGILEEGYEETK